MAVFFMGNEVNMLWLILALVGALSTSFTTIFAKIGIKDVKSNFATTYRTFIVIVCCVVICLITGSFQTITTLSYYNWIFIVLSGIATGCSWLCYYRALKLADASKVAPIDKSSFILTSILFLILFFDDATNGGDTLTMCMLFLSMALMFAGTILMVYKKIDKSQNEENEEEIKQSKKWLFYPILSSVFASLVALFVKIGLKGISSDLGTLFRTIVVFVFALAITLAKKEYKCIQDITPKSWIFLTLSGLATGVAWLCEYYALNIDGTNPIAVNSISKLSILFTMLFSFSILKEKFTKRSLLGLILLTAGIVLIIVFSL